MSDLKLTDRNWGRFTIGDLFHIKIGKSIDANKVNRKSGKIAYITRKELNNGLDGFIDYESDFLNNDYPVLTIGNETAEPFVQCYPFFTGTKVNILKPKQELSASVLSFVAVNLKQHKSKYSYSFTINSTRLKKQVILLPVNSDGLPDWQFMEDFIKQKEQKQIADLKDYYADKAVELMISTGSLKNTRWKSFFIGGKEGIFQIRATKSGIDKNKLKVSENGKTPYITRSDMDNGINLFVSDEQMPKYKKDDGNVITIGLDTQTVFYQKNSFWTGQNIQVLSNDNLNYWVAMFVIPLLKIQMKKFAWGSTGATLGRLNRTRIMLPVNSDGLPDWQFMEDFMKQIEWDKIAAVLSYYNNSLNNNNLPEGG